MATSLLALLDDITVVLDDVAVLTKIAAKKTAGVLGDDLALNAQQVAGVASDRELPVVWAVAKGSALNKLILVPAALAISVVAPMLITPLLMLGGAYLCFEGFEKVAHKWLHSAEEDEAEHEAMMAAAAKSAEELLAFERDKIRGAIRTDFILSAEIIVIALGSAADAPFVTQALVLTVIAVLMTVGVYGLVAGIVKLDDAGAHLARREGDDAAFQRRLGEMILLAAPKLMKGLSIAGTAAMFLVGGGILVHGIGPLHHWVEHLPSLAGIGVNAAVGIAIGGVLVAAHSAIQGVRGGDSPAP